MTIKVAFPSESHNGKIRKLVIPFPLSLAKAGFIWKFVPEEEKKYMPYAKEIVSILKDYKSQNGSWNLIEVDSPSENVHVVIRV